jgi:hypothetical protein
MIMNNYLRKTKPFVMVLILSIALINTSCSKEEQGEQPDLPPAETMMMFFTDFQTIPGGSVKGSEAKLVGFTYENFTYAYNQLRFWNSLTLSTMLIPYSAYEYALQQEPEYVGNNAWEWSFTIMAGDQEFIATLTGKRLDNEKFSMVMNLALSSVPLVKMKYFEGICRYDHTIASWDIYEFNGPTSVKTIEIDWSKDFETGDANLMYTYVKPGEEETDHKITWNMDPDATYDASYYIDLKDTDTYIEWNTTSKAGRVKVEETGGGFDWSCWNEFLQDITCPV